MEYRRQFLMIEYQRSFDAFYKGIDIGFSFVRFYFVVNGLFLALIGLSVRWPDNASEYVEIRSVIFYAVPIFGCVFSFFLLFMIKQYDQHLDNCSARCAEIERMFGGRLFCDLKRIDKQQSVKSLHSFHVVFGSFFVFWLLLSITSMFDLSF